ncbi:Mus7/MMS22 family-domain-containing protein [Melanogaster broomeanus]|nr:Mus7/MMS22 family-domain-containing protein [Melanogaster broomeanus]
MEVDEVVDTSDVEEREHLDPSEADFWAFSSPERNIHEDVLALSQSAARRSDVQREGSSIMAPIQSGHELSNCEMGSPSPRKRMKIFHHDSSLPASSARSTTYTTSPLMSPSSKSRMHLVTPLRLQPKRSQSMSVEGDDDGQSVPLAPPCYESPRSDWNSLFSSPPRPSAVGFPSTQEPPDTHHTREGSPRPLSTPQPLPDSLSSRSRSLSTDPWSLFSSPLRGPSTPLSRRSCDQFSPKGQERDGIASSPLTPASSPTHATQIPSPSPDPLQLISPVQHARRISSPILKSKSPLPHSSGSALSLPADNVPPAIPEDPYDVRRYSLRRREARQLNPYAYDKVLYKQQMKSNPEAVVKFRSPRRRSGSRGDDEDATQGDYLYELDNPDEDEDYVDREDRGGRRRGRRTENVDLGDESGEQGQEREAGEKDEGWLPETLKALSSSDDDDHDEIRKLAKQVRRAKEKAEAKGRAEARKAAIEARKAEAEVRNAVKKRPRAFPISGSAKHLSKHHPDPDAYEVQSSSTPLFIRARSKSALPSRSPTKSPSKYRPSPSRPSSLSPIPRSTRGKSPSFDYDCLQEEDFYPFNDDERFLREPSPGSLPILDFEPPPSPSAPPTASSASAVPSNASEQSSESGSGSDPESIPVMSAKDRKRLRVLKRMMPAAMIARQLETGKSLPPSSSHPKVSAVSSGSEAEEVRAIPGLARARMGKHRDVEVKGDPESSDVERHIGLSDDDGNDNAGFGAIEVLSDGQATVKVARTRKTWPRFEHADEVISLSDGSSLAASSEDSKSMSSDDEQGQQSLFDRPSRGPARERSLIDWMLSRTRDTSGPKKSKHRKSRISRKSHIPGKQRVEVVTSGARRYGEQYQTLLPFTATTTLYAPTSRAHRSTEHHKQVVFNSVAVEESKTRKKKRKAQHGTTQGPVFNIHHSATRITSKHRQGKSYRGRSALVIEKDDSDFRQALDPGWRAEIERWNKPVSSAHLPAAVPSTSAPKSRLYHRASTRPRDEGPLPLVFERGGSVPLPRRHILIDMNIIPFPSGVKFGPSTYIGKGLLHQLVSVTTGQSEVTPPMSCNVQGFDLGPTTSAAVFSTIFGPLCDRLTSSLHDREAEDVGKVMEWEQIFRVSCQLVSWFAVHAEDGEFDTLEMAVREYSDGLLSCLQSLGPSVFSLTAHWFVVELSARLAIGVRYRGASPEQVHLMVSVKQLMQHIMGIDLQPAFSVFHEAETDIETTSLPYRAAELWICLVHLFQSWETSAATVPAHMFWHLLADMFPESFPTGAEASEDMWRILFSLSALSQFSVHGLSTSTFRLPAAWDLVAVALKKIVLTANPNAERQLPPRALKKRDDYLSCVVSRCFLLWSQWGWHLDDAMPMFKTLQEIFRSRNFVNLLNERSVSMGFLENRDLELLSKRDPHDSVFEYQIRPEATLSIHQETSPNGRPCKPCPLLSFFPSLPHALSMLVNRFNAMAMAVHLDATPLNVKFRIGQARRCVSFKEADAHSRLACVYGNMYFAMIVRHHGIVGGLEEVLGWLGEMADVLMDEYKDVEGSAGTEKRATTTMLVQLLVGSVRRVIETQSLDKGHVRVEYPDPALLDGPWVTRVFNPRTNLATIAQTGVEIRMLVQSFLNARLKALPQAQLPPPLPIAYSAESQESQDEYDKLFLDLGDAELLAALGNEPEIAVVTDLKAKEDALCKVLDKSITPGVYRLICKHFGEDENVKNLEDNTNTADEWIDCWVGCANVLVQNNHKEWGLYMKLGQQSWEKIIDSSWRRRVGLRFNLTLLRLDPGAYATLKDEFISVLLVATLSCQTTIEHEFASVVFSLDGLQYPLLQGAPFDPVPGTRKFEITQGTYDAARLQLIETVFSNVARCLRAKLDAETQAYAELVVMMLSTMRDIYQTHQAKTKESTASSVGKFFVHC